MMSFISDGSSEEGMSGLGSPSDPCLSPLAWSVTGKYLASAMEKMVNIWQVNGKQFILSDLFWVFVTLECINDVIYWAFHKLVQYLIPTEYQ